MILPRRAFWVAFLKLNSGKILVLSLSTNFYCCILREVRQTNHPFHSSRCPRFFLLRAAFFIHRIATQKEFVPSVRFLNIFSLFLSKRRCSSQQISLMKRLKWPLTMFLSIGANLELIEKNADQWDAKNLRPIWPKKKFFFWLFHAETTLECLSRFEIFWDVNFDIKAAPPPAVITIQEKVPFDIFIYNVEKFNLLA